MKFVIFLRREKFFVWGFDLVSPGGGGGGGWGG